MVVGTILEIRLSGRNHGRPGAAGAAPARTDRIF